MSASIAIRGAGAAGLSLAQRVLERNPNARICMFDRRPRLPHPPRTFCGFHDPEIAAVVEPSFSWSRVAFADEGFQRTVACPERPYCLTRGDVFFDKTLRFLEERGVEFHWECGQVHAEQRRVAWDGHSREFDVVVDAAFRPDGQQAVLWQSFAGVWITTRQAVFDPQEALLMELRDSGPGISVQFMYVLPTTADTALVEHTVFAPRPMTCGWHLAQCRAWLADRRIKATSMEAPEYGTIPMGLRAERVNAGGPLRIGSNAGAIRASTGYAYQAIQRQAVDLAERITAGAGMPMSGSTPPAYPGWLQWGDALFLRALARAPEHGRAILGQLLRTAPERELLRFLSGRVSLAEALRVMMHVPKRKMVRAICSGGSDEERHSVVRRVGWTARRSRAV